MHGRKLPGGWQEWVDIDQSGAIGMNIQEREIMVTWTGVIEVESRTVGRCWSYLSGKINKTYSDD